MKKQTYMSAASIRRLTAISLFCAMAYVSVLLFRIKVVFLTFELKDVFIGLCAMVYGPVAGLLSSVGLALIEMVTISDTGFYGFIMNALSSLFFVCPAALLYSKKRTLKRAGIGFGAGVFSMTAVMLLANLLITPYYMGIAVSEVVPLLATLILPFNLVKAIANSALIFSLYEPVTKAMQRAGLIQKQRKTEIPPLVSENTDSQFVLPQSDIPHDENQSKRRYTPITKWIVSVSLCVFLAAILVLVLILDGKASLF